MALVRVRIQTGAAGLLSAGRTTNFRSLDSLHAHFRLLTLSRLCPRDAPRAFPASAHHEAHTAPAHTPPGTQPRHPRRTAHVAPARRHHRPRRDRRNPLWRTHARSVPLLLPMRKSPNRSTVTKQPSIFAPVPPGHTTSPPGATASFHLTFPSAQAVETARIALPRAGARILGFPARPGAKGKRHHPAFKFASTGEDAARWSVNLAGKEWLSTEGKRARNASSSSSGTTAAAAADEESTILDRASTSSPPPATNSDTLNGYLAALIAANPAPLALAKRGHQVLLRGLPASVSEENVRELGAGFRIDDTYGVWRVPKYVLWPLPTFPPFFS